MRLVCSQAKTEADRDSGLRNLDHVLPLSEILIYRRLKVEQRGHGGRVKKNQIEKQPRLNGLEICRFVCALGVIVWHYQHFFVEGLWQDAITHEQRHAFPLYHLFFPFYQYGGQAVQIFWAISGYIFFWKYGQVIHDKGVSTREFFILRFSRLYPLHFVTLIIVALGQFIYSQTHGVWYIYDANTVTNFILHVFFASNWLPSQPTTFNGPGWSVSVEILVYALFFFIMKAFRPSVALCVSMIALCAIPLHFYFSAALECMQIFFAGGLAYLLCSAERRLPRKAIFFTSIFLMIVTVAAAFRFHFSGPWKDLLLATEVVIAASMVEDALQIDLSRLKWMGNMTYSSYLLHFPIQLFLVLYFDAVVGNRNAFYSPIAFVLFLVFTFTAAHFTHRLFEMPAQDKIRDNYLRQRLRSVPQSD